MYCLVFWPERNSPQWFRFPEITTSLWLWKGLCRFQAKEIFDKLCPGEEFLPKAPNPEDIVFEDEGMAKDQGSGFEAPGSEDQSEAGKGSLASGAGKECVDADHETKAIVGDSNELTSQEGSTTYATNEEKHKSGSVENQSQNSWGSSHEK